MQAPEAARAAGARPVQRPSRRHMISYRYDIIYMISYENTYNIIWHDMRYHMYMISYLMYTISCP
jgi:hypothetical protein